MNKELLRIKAIKAFYAIPVRTRHINAFVEDVLNEDEWFKAENAELPDGQYLCCAFLPKQNEDKWKYSVFSANFYDGCFHNNSGYTVNPTHYQPLPKEPKK